MKHFFIIHFFSILFFQGIAQTVSDNDLSIIIGKWTGVLTYLDYTSNIKDSVKTSLVVEKISRDHFQFRFIYSNESSHNSKDNYTIRRNGEFVNDMKVLERTKLADGSIRIVLEDKGTDGNDNKPATFHHILLMSDDSLSMTRMVNYSGSNEYFQRNQFVFRR